MTDQTLPMIDKTEILNMTSDIVSSYVSNNPVAAEHVSELIKTVHSTITELTGETAKPEPRSKPAVAVSRSVHDEYIVCLEDGKKLKMLKRYLRSQYELSPDEYRRKWNLPSDYPMVAPAYSRKRSQFAKDIGLGRAGKE